MKYNRYGEEMKVERLSESDRYTDFGDDYSDHGMVATHIPTGTSACATQWKDRTKNRQLAVIRVMAEVIESEREAMARMVRAARGVTGAAAGLDKMEGKIEALEVAAEECARIVYSPTMPRDRLAVERLAEVP